MQEVAHQLAGELALRAEADRQDAEEARLAKRDWAARVLQAAWHRLQAARQAAVAQPPKKKKAKAAKGAKKGAAKPAGKAAAPKKAAAPARKAKK